MTPAGRKERTKALNEKRVAVISSGNGGQSMAAWYALHGWEVRLYAREAERVAMFPSAEFILSGAVSGRAVAVQMTGGELVVDVERRGSTVEHLFLTGPTNMVAKGELTDEELPL